MINCVFFLFLFQFYDILRKDKEAQESKLLLEVKEQEKKAKMERLKADPLYQARMNKDEIEYSERKSIY